SGPRRDDDRRPRFRDGDDRPRRSSGPRPIRDGGRDSGQRGDRRPRRDFGDDRGRRDSDEHRPRRDFGDNRRRQRDDGARRRDDRGPRREDNRRPRRDFGDDRGRGRGEGRSEGRGEGRGRVFRDGGRPVPQTAAQRKREEVRSRTGGRRTKDVPDRAPDHTSEQWIDEGSTRQRRERAVASVSKKRTKKVRALDSVVAEFEKALGKRHGKYLQRYEAALAAFEAQRYKEARIALTPLAKECSDIASVHDLLGLCLYREENFARAIEALEVAQRINAHQVFNHAVLADCHRALKSYDRVDELWAELRDASPHPELLAEGRIVFAGSLVDRGRLEEARDVMEKVSPTSSKPSKGLNEYHLRQWYVLGDIYDHLGDVVNARRVFETILSVDTHFADVPERLSTLGA
ncbi:MAG: tetratricopeptide repeat protein, partial [Actinobacteria bacterium]|nr:tetratricopeptide repeat protein [Actinomycetota bacterium]